VDSAILVDGRATSLVPMEESIWPSGNETNPGVGVDWCHGFADEDAIGATEEGG
jgi:hypothetical protein